jgi:hypothetical protein
MCIRRVPMTLRARSATRKREGLSSNTIECSLKRWIGDIRCCVRLRCDVKRSFHT